MLAYIYYPDWIKPEIIPGLPLRWYGLMYLVAFAITFYLFRYQVKEHKLDIKDDHVVNFFFWGIIGLLLGARIFAALIYDPTGRYIRNPLLIFWPFDENFRFVGLQGMSYHGGLLGAIVAIVIYSRIKKFDLFDWGDMLIAGIPLGYTFGRLGNFINAELYGRVTTVSWGMIFPTAEVFPVKEQWVQEVAERAGLKIDSTQQFINLPRHPSQLYEAFFEGIVLWLILWFVFRKRKPFTGFLLGVYLIGYGFVRFVIEYFREPDVGIGFPIKLVNIENPPYLLLTPWNFTTGQILCFFMIVGGVGFLIIRRAIVKRGLSLQEKTMKKQDMRKLRKKLK
ncbi:MAG: prolipoprotein diacylglyceryl transferase [Spirochaetes bacterium]|nr:MAG: prolipoprotein diacylglyceryl transferase [Spirochaetota bacterium]